MVSKLQGNIDLLDSNIRGKKVLVLGSGPSATEMDWRSYERDTLVTTSFFYLNSTIVEAKPLHVTLSDIVDLQDKTLINYLENNPKCTIGFEPKNSTFYFSKTYKEFANRFKDRILTFYIPGGKEGVASRTCWLVVEFKPTQLITCGIDGISKDVKKDPPNFFRGHKGTMDDYGYNTYKKDYTLFSKKLESYSNRYGIELINLGKGKPYNMLTF